MSGVLTRAESRALRMTAENGSCAFEFNSICTILTIVTRYTSYTLFPTLEELRARRGMIAYTTSISHPSVATRCTFYTHSRP